MARARASVVISPFSHRLGYLSLQLRDLVECLLEVLVVLQLVKGLVDLVRHLFYDLPRDFARGDALVHDIEDVLRRLLRR